MAAMTRQQEVAAIARLVEEFGAEIMVSIRDRTSLTRSQRTIRRVEAIEYVEGCASCDVCSGGPRGYIELPSHPGKPATIAVIGDAPTFEAHKAQRPFAGRTATVLRSSLAQVGIDPAECIYFNAVSGYPNDDGMMRPPTAGELAACSTNLMTMLRAADVRYVLLLGATALKAWRADLQLSKMAGHLYVWRPQWFVWPMFHPNAVLRQSIDPATWKLQLARFAQTVADDSGLDALRMDCPECSSSVYLQDEDGVPWCGQHWRSQVSRNRKPDRALAGQSMRLGGFDNA